MPNLFSPIGDIFLVRGGTRAVEFKVVETYPSLTVLWLLTLLSIVMVIQSSGKMKRIL